MAVCCDLEVDINGEETFLVNKKILLSYSGRLRKLFGKSASATRNLKVIFNDFPGGAESFELISRFCYKSGRIDITPSNISLLYSAAQFLEMDNSVSVMDYLLEQTEKSLQEINYWTWSELLATIKQNQDLLPLEIPSGVLEKCVDSIIGRMVLSSEPSPCLSTSSQDSSRFRFSFDTRSTESLKNGFSRATWWFEDLLVLNANSVEMLTKSMISRKSDHVIIGRFLLYYQKSKCYAATTDENRRIIIETVVDMLYILDWSSVSCKSLFVILGFALNLNISKCSRNKLESMIGCQMDQATLDNLLIPSPYGTNYLYDVNLVLRLLKAFVHGGICQVSPMRLKRVVRLMDSYLAEIAPDPCLKPSKFLAVALALPDSVRASHDDIYHAMDMFLEVHVGLSRDEKIKMCCALNYEKLSTEACIHLSQNRKFPSTSSIQALISQKVKLKSFLHVTSNTKCYSDSPCSLTEIACNNKRSEASEQIVLYARKLDLPNDNKKLRAHLQGMQWRVMELEKACKKMQTQMTKIMKSKVSSHGDVRSLPRVCS